MVEHRTWSAKQIAGLPNNEAKYAVKWLRPDHSVMPPSCVLKSATFLHSLTRIACNTHD